MFGIAIFIAASAFTGFWIAGLRGGSLAVHWLWVLGGGGVALSSWFTICLTTKVFWVVVVERWFVSNREERYSLKTLATSLLRHLLVIGGGLALATAPYGPWQIKLTLAIIFIGWGLAWTLYRQRPDWGLVRNFISDPPILVGAGK